MCEAPERITVQHKRGQPLLAAPRMDATSVEYVRADLYAAKERECERLLEYIAQFVKMDDVGDDTFVLGAVIDEEALAESLFRHIAPAVRNEEEYNPYHNNDPKQVIARAALAEEGVI